VVPPQHQTLAGGIAPVRTSVPPGEEFNVVADGKTPLSEIPFEDVDLGTALTQPSSSSSASGSGSRTFEETHHTGIGDTRGHTNS